MAYTEPLANQADSSWSGFEEYTLPSGTTFNHILGSNVPVIDSLISNSNSIVFSSSSELRKHLLQCQSTTVFSSLSLAEQENITNIYFKYSIPSPYVIPAHDAVNFEWGVNNSNPIQIESLSSLDFYFTVQELTTNAEDLGSIDFTFEIQTLVAQNALINIQQPLLGFVCEWQTCSVSRLHEIVYDFSPSYIIHSITYVSVSSQQHLASYCSEFVAAIHHANWTLQQQSIHAVTYQSTQLVPVFNSHNVEWRSIQLVPVFNSHNIEWRSFISSQTLHNIEWRSFISSQTLHNIEWRSIQLVPVFNSHNIEWRSFISSQTTHHAEWKSIIEVNNLHIVNWRSTVDDYKVHVVSYHSNNMVFVTMDNLIYVRV